MTRRAYLRLRWLGLGLVVIIAIARSLPILWWGDIYFDADEAVVGLMAKHAAEGSALPVFQYALRYVLMVEAWLAAPLMLIADNSVVLLKAVPAVLHAATVGVLYLMLTSTPGLGPIAALVAVAPVTLTGEVTTQDLTKALGMNVEPLLFTLMLWLLRTRPIPLGIIAAVAVKNREFALYAIAALVLVDVLRDRSAALWRGRVLALVAFTLTWAGIEILRQHSSPLGPQSSLAMLTEMGDNMSVAVGAMCIEPRLMPNDVWLTFTRLLPVQFGIVSDARSMSRAYGARPLEALWLWGPLVAVLLVGVGLGVLRAWRSGPSPMTWLGGYLILVGSQAVMVYALTRCGHVSTHTMRYTLLSLFIPAGAIVLALERESRPIVRALVGGTMVVWMAVSALGHLTLVRTLDEIQPQGTYRRLATYLESRGVEFIITDYWTGYHVAFLSGERIKALTNFERVHDYTLAVRANLDRAVEVRRVHQAHCDGGVEVAGFYVCPPIESSPRP